MKKLILGIFVFAIAVVVAVPAYAKADKVDICHVEGNGSYHLINVSTNAVPAHLAHGDGLPSGVVPGMSEGYYFTDECGVEFVRSAEITSPTAGQELNVGDTVTFAATLWDKDKDDSVQWAVRKGTCSAGIGTVWGNVDTHNDLYAWVSGMYFSSTADTTDWDGGNYCFVFNPTESVGDALIRETRGFTLIAPVVCDYFVTPTGDAPYGGFYGGTVTPVNVTYEDCSMTYALKTETTQNFSRTGWAGWSCVEEGYLHVVGGGVVPANADVTAQGSAKYGTATIGGADYPFYPHYNYNGGVNASDGEEGWVVQSAGPNPPTGIYVLCGE